MNGKEHEKILLLADIAEKHSQKFDPESFLHDIKLHHIILADYAKALQNNDMVESIVIEEGKVYIKFRGYDIKMNISFDNPNNFAYQVATVADDVEPGDRMKIMALAQGKKCIFDIGANLGWYSLLLSKLNPKSKIFSFEPIPKLFEQLSINVRLNEITNVFPFQMALMDRESDFDGELMYYNDFEPGAASFRNIRDREEFEAIRVHTTTLDSFCSEHDSAPDFMKIDVEGSELSVLRGAEHILRKHHPVLFVEILRKFCAKFGHSAMDVVDFLKSCDYKMYTLQDSELIPQDEINEDTIETNFYFY